MFYVICSKKDEKFRSRCIKFWAEIAAESLNIAATQEDSHL